jgi:hypothetical protein
MIITGVDADLIVYAAAFVAEKKEKEGVYLTWYQVSKVVDTIYRTILKGSQCTHHLGFLTDGKSNFRNKRATTLVYKGDRKTNESKPHFYKEIIEYLISNWSCQMMKGIEADDALVIAGEHYKRKGIAYVLASKDKDLRQWEGQHYCMNVNKLLYIDAEEGHRNFWRQMIMGDMATDNIPGLSHAAKHRTTVEFNKKVKALPEHQYGVKTADAILDTVEPEDYARHILELYIDAYDDIEEGLGEYRYYETYDLVRMLETIPQDVEIHYNATKIQKIATEFDDLTEEY